MKNIRLTIAFFTALLPAALSAQVRVDAPGAVALDEQFNITFTLTEKPSRFEWEPGDNFTLVWGPQTGSSTSISIINGKTTKSSQYTYTYVLMPKNKGTFTLPAGHAVVSGRDEYSKAPTIEVVGNGSSQAAAQPQQQSQQSSSGSSSDQGQSVPATASSSDMFITFNLSRTNVVVGEPITATLKLYTRGNIAGFEDVKFPTFNGFWSQEVVAPQSIEFQRETLGDRIYNAALLRRWVIIPQKSGQITVDPAEMVCLVQQRISSGNSIFDGFFDDYQTIRKRLVSKAQTVTVRALPAGAPDSFTGAVGDFKISATMGKDSLKVHDAASLKITVSGNGNVALIGAPKVAFPPDSEVYDTKTTDNLQKGSGGTSGSRVFEYPFIPRSHGDFEIPPVEFTYFDVSSRKYVTVTTKPISYKVAQGDATDYVSPSGVSIPKSAGRDVRNIGEDIHFITTRLPNLSGEGKFFVGTPLFNVIIVLILLLGTGAYFGASKLRKNRSDVVLVRTKSASKVARKRLALAGGYLAKNLYSAFYEELHKALLGYAADKLNIAGSDMSKDTIAAGFKAAGAPESLICEYTDLLDSCEFARYAPDAGNAAMHESYDKAMTVISSIDANMGKKPINKTASLLVLLLLLLPASMQAAENQYADSLWNAGVEAYSNGDYVSAQQNFQAIESIGLSSTELYTNIADCFFKTKQIAPAILYYERALKLDPSNKDARFNMEITRALCQDRIEVVPEFFLKTWFRNICYILPSNTWAFLAIIMMAGLAAAVLLLLLGRKTAVRKTGFFASIAALLLFALCLTNASWQKSDFEHRDAAIVYKPVTSAKSAPSASGADLFILHEGTKVKVLDTVGDWINISLADGREGWIPQRDATII